MRQTTCIFVLINLLIFFIIYFLSLLGFVVLFAILALGFNSSLLAFSTFNGDGDDDNHGDLRHKIANFAGTGVGIAAFVSKQSIWYILSNYNVIFRFCKKKTPDFNLSNSVPSGRIACVRPFIVFPNARDYDLSP